ncbi:MAG TPA: protein kinase [Kofleriaceae bacterium]|nr:protein kinase [Kofleriaceae bacterium]
MAEGLRTTVEAADTAAPASDPTLPSSEAEPPRSPGPGGRIGRYEIGAQVGAGGMGVVYRASDPDLKRPLAIKLVRHAGGSVGQARVLREAQAMARLRHPNVVPVFDVGTYDGRVYLVMPLLEGGTLGAWMRSGARPWREVIARFGSAARGLAAAHAVGLVHRDFKPDNVLIGVDDEIQVADFGLARIDHDDAAAVAPGSGDGGSGPAITQAGEIMGTPAYMAPEQLDGSVVDAAADQFSFCVALYEALYGHRPFGVAKGVGSDVSAIASLRDSIRRFDVRPSTEARDVPRWLRAVVVRGLREDPSQRWPSMAALIAALEEPLHRPRRTRLTVALVGGVVALGAVAWIATRPAPSRPPRTAAPAEPAPKKWVETPLTFRGDVVDAALSPDGTTLAVTAGRDLLTLPAGGGPPHVVVRNVSDDDDSEPSWSLDGKQIMLLGSRTQVVDVATGTTTRTQPWGYARFVSATELVTATQPEKRLRFVDAKAQGVRRTCELPGDYRWITGVDAVAGTIYVTVRYEDGATALIVTNTECFLPHVMVPRGEAFKFIPVADGRVFAFHGPHKVEARVHDADGKELGPPQQLPAGVIDVVAVRGDDSFVLQRTVTSWRLFRQDGTTAGELARGSMYPFLAFAPDGHRVALIERIPGSEGVLYLADLDAIDDRSRRLLDDVGGVAWSPDGTRLAAVSRSGKPHIVEIDVATGAVRDLAIDDASEQTTLTWLDDRRVAYMRPDHRAFRWFDRVDGTRGDLLDDTRGWAFNLTASRADGSLALFWNRDQRGIWVVPPDGKPQLVTAGDNSAFAWSSDGRTLWFAEGSRLERYDPRSRKRTLFRTVDIDPNVQITGLFPVGPDAVLVQTSAAVSDLALWAPE